jgi:hypothetical protein
MQMGLSFAPLSLELLSFSATVKSNGISLYWATTSEKNIEKFIVQRGEEYSDFNDVGEVASTSTSSASNEYSFLDKDAAREKKMSYRLKVMEKDGSFFYSKTIVVEDRSSDMPLSISPVPFKSGLFVTLTVRHAGKAHFALLDIAGRKVASLSRFLGPGTHTVKLDGLNDLPSGTYLMAVEADNREYRQKVSK